VSSGNRGRYLSENQEFIRACGLCGTQNECLSLDTAHSWEAFLSTIGAMIAAAARIIKSNISRKEETFTFKSMGTKKCNQVMVMIKPERNAMTPDQKPSAAENFLRNFLDASRMPPRLRQDLQSHRQINLQRCGDSLARRL
jgi:hypothetical protein